MAAQAPRPVPDSAGITKPFHYPELLARIGAVLKRVSRAREAHEMRYGGLAVNMLSREVTVAGVRVELSAKEFALLATLAADPERVFTKRELLQMVWDFRSHGKTRTTAGSTLPVYEPGGFSRAPSARPWSRHGHNH